MEEIIINIIATIITFCIFFGGPILIIGYFIYEYRYYQGEEFAKIKKKLQNLLKSKLRQKKKKKCQI